MPRAGWAVVLFLFHTAGFAEETDAAAAVRLFYAHLSGGDVAGAGRLWSGEQRPQFERRYARIAAVRCMRVESLDLRSAVDADVATVDAELFVAEWHAAARAERLARRQSRFRLRRAGGSWQIEEWLEKEQELADAIAVAETDAMRAELLARNGALVGLELGDALTKRILRLSNESKIASAHALNAIVRRIAEDHLDDRLLAKVLSIDGVLARRPVPPDFAAAIALGEESARLAEASGDPDTLMQVRLRLIRARRAAHPDEPVDFADALALTDQVEDLSIAAHMATMAAWYFDSRAEHRQALTHSLLAEKYAEAGGDLSARLNAHMNLSGTYEYRSDFALADAHNLRALALAREANFPETVCTILERLARVRFATMDMEGGLRRVDELLKVATSILSSSHIAMALSFRGRHALLNGDFAAAEADLTRVQAAADLSQEFHLGWDARNNLAWLRYEQRRYEEALALVDDVGLRATILWALGRHAEAETGLRAQIAMSESKRADVGVDPQQMRAYNSRIVPLSSSLVQLLLDCGRVDEALEELERRKATVLRDVLARAGGTAVAVLSVDERNRLREIEARLDALNCDVRRPTSSRQELVMTRLELAEQWSRIYAAHPELEWTSVPSPTVRELTPATNDIVYASYAVLDAKVVVFTLTRDAHGFPAVRSVDIDVDRKELRNRVQQFTRQVETRDLRFAGNAQALYDLLLRPIEAELFQPGRRICIIPDDELWRLPFHALKASRNAFVAEKASIFYAPSINVVNELMTRAVVSRGQPRPRGQPRLLAFGNPSTRGAVEPLPAAESEVRGIAQLYPPASTRVRLNGSADEARFKADVASYDVVHIAAHAQYDESPMYSAVLLSESASEDGRLEARELASLKLDARLVVISACDSARGDHRTGEGVVGLPWALLATGTRSSVVSLWPVDSTATSRLMQEFHRSLLANDFASVSDALRDAQLSLRQSAEYSHPYYWAPFIAVGAD